MANKTTGLEQSAANMEEEVQDQLYAARAEINTFKDLETQRGTPIPALFNQFFKFIQNPSTVSVETFKRMVDTDDTVGSGVDFLTICLAARLGRYQHPSEEITEFVNKALDEMDVSWYETVKELLSATWNGFAVQEKVWANTDMGYVPKKIVTLPPSTVIFETDRTGVLTEDGILQYQRNYNPHLLTSGMGFFGSSIGGSSGFGIGSKPDPYAKLGDLPYPMRVSNAFNYMSIRIPRMKCIHYAFDAQGKFGNPYGRSMLRRAYKYYVMKDAFLQMLAIALDRKGTPLTIVYTDPNSTLLDSKSYDSNKRPQDQKKMRAQFAAAEAFKNVHNDSTIFLPGKKGQMFDVDFTPQSSNAADFLSALDFCNKSLMRAMLLPSLIFTNGDGTGSYSLGQEHARTFDKILDGHLEGLKDVLQKQLIHEIIAYNFPKSAWQKDGFGSFAKRDMTKDEIDKEMDMFEKGINSGIIDNNDLNDLNKMRDTLGFDPKNEVLMTEQEEQDQKDLDNGKQEQLIDQ